MRPVLAFCALLVATLGLLTWGAIVGVNATTRGWFERDVALRAELAVNGSRRSLTRAWRGGQWSELGQVLADVTHDERILGAAVCTAAGDTLARTGEYPGVFGCGEVTRHVFASAAGAPWRQTAVLPGGSVHASAFPLADEGGSLGAVVLVHDMSFVQRREAVTRRFLLIAFAVLASGASLLTLAGARMFWRGWSDRLRRLLRGDADDPEFKPLVQDVRALVERLAGENVDAQGGRWTPQRLRQTLKRHLRGERVLVVANREPYIHERRGDGVIEVLHPASGVVTALEPVMRACSGVWIAHGSGSADRETADRRGRIAVPPGEESYVVRRVWLSPEEEKGYYYGFANEGLWPLCHMAHIRPTFRSSDWGHYQAVNARFADAVCAEVDSEDPIILVQDYHFAIAPRLIRERLPRATIITFWHIPWPHAEGFGICPWRTELLEGLLGSSILGFHTQLHCNNFIDAVDRYMEARIDRERSAIVLNKRPTLVRPYPISVDWPSRWAQDAPSAAECHGRVRAELGLRPDTLLGVGVDRLDYTKGVEERMLAVERLLERFPAYLGRFVFVQLAAPSRSLIPQYRDLARNVTALAERINERFGREGYQPIILRRAHHEPPAVFEYYRAADLCYVSSLHDGMNLVAKEFVASRDDERGVLVLSSLTGAARELTEALIVNPYDLEEASAALAAALDMSPREQQDRMRAMRSLVRELNVYRWAGRMLVDAARLRQRERLSGRLTDLSSTMEGVA
jgi:trehalose 6-phosphate synthase